MKTRVGLGPPECHIIAAIGIFLEEQPDIGFTATLCSQSIYVGQVGFRVSMNLNGNFINVWKHLDDEGISFPIAKIDLNDPSSLMKMWNHIVYEFKAFIETSNHNSKTSQSLRA